MQKRFVLLFGAIALGLGACSSASGAPPSDAPEPVTYDALITEITTSGEPTVVNSWASWCPPCRSEAPLLAIAAKLNDGIHFVMLNTNDNPADAAEFISQAFSDAPMTQYADTSGAVTFELGGGRGLPVTFFYDSAGEIVQIHRGILDEPTLAFYLDEITR
jgi:thiol-disulfide isomerase/thioredoxin